MDVIYLELKSKHPLSYGDTQRSFEFHDKKPSKEMKNRIKPPQPQQKPRFVNLFLLSAWAPHQLSH